MLCKHFIYAQEDIRCGCYWRKRRYTLPHTEKTQIFALCATFGRVDRSDSSRCTRIILWSLTLCMPQSLKTRAFRIHFDFQALSNNLFRVVYFFLSLSLSRIRFVRLTLIQCAATTLSQTPFQSFLSLQSNLLSVMNRFFLSNPFSMKLGRFSHSFILCVCVYHKCYLDSIPKNCNKKPSSFACH